MKPESRCADVTWRLGVTIATVLLVLQACASGHPTTPSVMPREAPVSGPLSAGHALTVPAGKLSGNLEFVAGYLSALESIGLVQHTGPPTSE